MLIVDGNSLVFRYAVFGSNVIGALNKLLSIIKKVSATEVVFVFDTNGKSFRYKLYPQYKATRNANTEVKEIISKVYDALCQEGIAAYLHEEADDLIASIAAWTDGDVVIVTNDKDLFQLVDGNRVSVYNLGDDKLYSKREQVMEKVGVMPEDIPAFLAIAGDSSDNIPGVKGIGPKGAIKVLTGQRKLDPAQMEAYNLFLKLTTLRVERVDVRSTPCTYGVFNGVARRIASWQQ